jgi:3-deoxy-D-manno-octulosonic-acid transferase
VGGSFKDFGGQNPLEPAAQGVPVVFGPFMKHFQDIAVVLLEAGAALKVEGAEKLGEVLEELLGQPERLKSMGEAGRREVARRTGAAEKTADLASKLLLIKTFKADNEQWRVESATQSQKTLEFGVGFDKSNS